MVSGHFHLPIPSNSSRDKVSSKSNVTNFTLASGCLDISGSDQALKVHMHFPERLKSHKYHNWGTKGATQWFLFKIDVSLEKN